MFHIQKIEKIVQKIDEPNLTETEIIKIENLNALDVAKVLNRFFSDQKQEIVKEFATSEGDTGAPEVQVALLTSRIKYLTTLW